MGESKVSMKLLVDSVGKRVLFAEAGKECVDFLFFILSLPVSTIVSLLGKQGMVGSLGNLYGSLETLNESYCQSNISKDTLLKPVCPIPGYSVPLLSLKNAPQAAAAAAASTTKNFYRCSNCTNSYGRNYQNVTDDQRATCPTCHSQMTSKMTYVAPPPPPPPAPVQQEAKGASGFVKDVVTYMVMDDLVVKPMSTISSITLLNQFNINNVSALEEKLVNLGMNEAVKLLKASLVSHKVLTDVFLDGKKLVI